MQTTYRRTRRWTRVESDCLSDQEGFQSGKHLSRLAAPTPQITVVDLLP
jgi:hypothetical protein